MKRLDPDIIIALALLVVVAACAWRRGSVYGEVGRSFGRDGTIAGGAGDGGRTLDVDGEWDARIGYIAPLSEPPRPAPPLVIHRDPDPPPPVEPSTGAWWQDDDLLAWIERLVLVVFGVGATMGTQRIQKARAKKDSGNTIA